jgi:predicted Zn-dependent peptidase
LADAPLSNFEDLVNQIQESSPEDLQRLFRTYWQPDAVTEVWVGPEKSLNRVK